MRCAPTYLRCLLPAVFVTLLVLAGCETSFDPFVQSQDRYFSIGGYLDAAADTQFVRIAPLRMQFEVQLADLDAVVRLTHLASGESTVWRDSLFQIGPVSAHNFWSAEPLRNGETYLFSVERSDGSASTATVTLPEAITEPLLCTIFDENSLTDPPVFVLQDVDRLAELEMIYDLRLRTDPLDAVRSHGISYKGPSRRTSYGQAYVTNVFDDLNTIAVRNSYAPLDLILLRVRVRVAAAGPDWPDPSLDLETLALPGVVSNVENGLGYLGGVATRTVSWPEMLRYLDLLGISVAGDFPEEFEIKDPCKIVRRELRGQQ